MVSLKNAKSTGLVKLHLGCGEKIFPGFVNVDVRKFPGVDLVMDLSDLSRFKNESVDVIYCSHHLEHFPKDQVPKILVEYYRILKPKGMLKVAVPDLDTIAKLYVEHQDWFTPPHEPWLGIIYGGQDYPYNFHKTGFNFRWLKYLLEKAGFVRVFRYEPSEEWGYRDASFARKPFKVLLSLNVQALKGNPADIDKVSPEFKYTRLEKFFAFLEGVVLRIEGKIVETRLSLIRHRLKGAGRR